MRIDTYEEQSRRSVLVVDDEPGIRTALTTYFAREGWQVIAASGVREAEYRLAQGEFNLLVSDIRLPDGSGADLLRAAVDTPAILMTAFGTVPDAVEAMRGGARDYLTKPVAWPQLRALAERFAGEGTAAAEAYPGTEVEHVMVGRSPAFLEARSRAVAAARADVDVVIEGEPGVGKRLMACFIHKAGHRAARPLLVADCGDPHAESELFGSHGTPGRLLMAGGGTLLLQRVERLPANLQAKLLHALEESDAERESSTPRLLATATPELRAAVNRGAFRSDLYNRLNRTSLFLPSLRNRQGDIPLLAEHFARQWASLERRSVPTFDHGALETLAAQSWPGNFAELKSVLARAFTQLPETGESVARAAIFQALQTAPEARAPTMPVPIRELERMHLERTLALTQGNRTHAAEMLGISLRTMRNKIREYGLPPRSYA